MSTGASIRTSSFEMFPQEVLEHIVYFAATDNFLGPPTGILPFLLLNRSMYSALSFANNPHLYARIFASKYDLAAAIRRMGTALLPATALAEELRRRSIILKRFHNLKGCRVDETDMVDEMLWTAYLMVLESDGANERQLREYARLNEWLKEYWFRPLGASAALRIVTTTDHWPDNTERMSLALWLFWYLLRPGEYLNACRAAIALTRYRGVHAGRSPIPRCNGDTKGPGSRCAQSMCALPILASNILISVVCSTHHVTQTGSTSFHGTPSNTQAPSVTSPQSWSWLHRHPPRQPYSHTSPWSTNSA